MANVGGGKWRERMMMSAMEGGLEGSAASTKAATAAKMTTTTTTTTGGGGVDDRIKGPWSPEEDVVLNRLVEKFGARNWSLIARGIPGRSGKSCRLRWCNQLNPGVKRKPFTGTSILTYLPKLHLKPLRRNSIHHHHIPIWNISVSRLVRSISD